MLPEADIKQYGGKGAILNHVRENIPDMPIPNYVIPENKKDIKLAFKTLKAPLIVRSSSPHEYYGFEGIFESKNNINDMYELGYAIQTVKNSAMSDRAVKYAEQNNISIDEQMKVIIQEQSPSKYSGVMMRHPHDPDRVFIQYFSWADSGMKNIGHRFTFSESGRDLTMEHPIKMISDDETANFLVEHYRQIEGLTDITNDQVLFVEFGLEPFVIYQARPFLKKETADFSLEKYAEIRNDSKSIYSSLCFGITPPEGVVFPVLRNVGVGEAHIWLNLLDEQKLELSSAERMLMTDITTIAFAFNPFMQQFQDILTPKLELYNQENDTKFDEPYCFMTSSVKNEKFDVDLSIPNMQGMIVGSAENFLTHGLSRLIKRANVSILKDSTLSVDKFYNQTKGLEHKVRIISNGKEAVAFRE